MNIMQSGHDNHATGESLSAEGSVYKMPGLRAEFRHLAFAYAKLFLYGSNTRNSHSNTHNYT